MADETQNPRNIPYLRASVGDLFRAREAPACDACGEELPIEDAGADDGFAIRGKGMYVSSRGDAVQYEDVPLCPSCGSAIALSALRQWENEEEEG
jgi:predicted RNA-binding Zn-ribbon protein involved in translation (DUF1610 family)